MADDSIARRNFLIGAGTAAAAGLAPASAQQVSPPVTAAPAAAPAGEVEAYVTLTATEAAFIAAAADTMVPADELSPSGSQCGIVVFADRQLASAWGGGAKMYRSGPFRKAKPEYGYQLPLTPRDYFSAGIAAANGYCRKAHGKEFDRLAVGERETVLKDMESGKADFGDLIAKDFFEALLGLVMEGFFSDPVYGGNKNKVSWKMLGYPGLPALYANLMDEYRGKRYVAEPKSIADFS